MALKGHAIFRIFSTNNHRSPHPPKNDVIIQNNITVGAIKIIKVQHVLKIFSKIDNFVKNWKFCQISKNLSKIENSIKNRKLCQKSKFFVKNRNFRQKLNFLSKNRIFCQKIEFFVKNPNFLLKSTKNLIIFVGQNSVEILENENV